MPRAIKPKQWAKRCTVELGATGEYGDDFTLNIVIRSIVKIQILISAAFTGITGKKIIFFDKWPILQMWVTVSEM